MRLFFDTGNFNVGKITFSPTTDPYTAVTSMKHSESMVYPMPAKDYITIKGQAILSRVTLMDIQGVVLENREGNGSLSMMLDIQKYPEGMYLLKIEFDNKQLDYLKILKLK
jgi:hypothetical protein